MVIRWVPLTSVKDGMAAAEAWPAPRSDRQTDEIVYDEPRSVRPLLIETTPAANTATPARRARRPRRAAVDRRAA